MAIEAQSPGDERGSFHVGLNAARDELCASRHCGSWINWQAGNGEGRDAVDRIEWRILVGAIAERVLEIVVHAKAGAEDGFIAKGTPSNGQARLRQESCVVGGEKRIADMRSAGDNAAGESVICSSAKGFIPSSGKFVAEAKGHGQLAVNAEDVFGVKSAEFGAPIHGSWRRIVKKG